MFRSRIPRIAHTLKPSRRFIHHVPRLAHEDQFVSQGIDGFLSPAAFHLSWTDYQSYVIGKLNQVLAGGEMAGKDVKQTLIRYAREPGYAPHFNFASMAHNNHFFFKTLSPTPVAMPVELESQLKASFGSIETLKQELITTASSMFGPGFVWLVKETSQNQVQYSVLCTYLAGTPYAEAHYREQSVDMNTESRSGPEAMRRLPVANTVGAHGPHSHIAKSSPGAAIVTPVLCLNTWEHVYVPDYVFSKHQYAENWWKKIDWVQVAEMAAVNTKAPLFT